MLTTLPAPIPTNDLTSAEPMKPVPPVTRQVVPDMAPRFEFRNLLQNPSGAPRTAGAPAANVRLIAAVLMGIACAVYVYLDRKSTRLNSSHLVISYAVFCLKKKK